MIERLRDAYGLKSDADLARKLGIKPATFTMQKSRGSLDLMRIITNCGDINFNYLFKGEGSAFTGSVPDTHHDLSNPIGRILQQFDVSSSTFNEVSSSGNGHTDYNTLLLTLLKTLSKAINTEISKLGRGSYNGRNGESHS